MADAPLRTARSSDFSSVRDDYSSWLDEMFPPSRLQSGEQLQHPNVSREKQENIAAKLKKTLPMELPLLNKRFVTQSAARRHGPKHEQRREEGAGEKSARNVMQGSRQPPPPRTKRSLSLPCSTLPVHHLHHHRHRPFEGRPHAASIRAPPSRHPATFPDMKYRSGRSSHQPGLRFFEYIPSRSFISMAATVAFLGPEAAKRAGGEVLWLRTNASGVIQRRVFSSAGCFVSSPKLRRRVALSLCGRDKGDGGIGTMRASASAPGALRRPRLGGRGTGAVPTGTSCCQTKDIQHPVALLKVCRSCGRHSGSRNDNNDDDNGSKRKRAREKKGGGSTDVLCLDKLSEIEEILLKAGEGGERLSEKRPDTATAQGQQQQRPPQEPNVDILCDNDGALGTKFKHDGDYQRTEKESDIAPEAGALGAGEAQAMALIGDQAVPLCSTSLKENVSQFPRRGLLEKEKAEEVQRPRPWAIQKYVRSKGPLAWVVRVVWRRNHDSFCWILSDSDPVIASDMSRRGGASSGASWCNAVRGIAGQAGWEAPKAFVADMVAALESAEGATATRIPLRFDLMAVDLIEDRDGKWWLTQVKAFRLLRSMGTALQSVSETARAGGAGTSGGCRDEALREPRRVTAEEAEMPPPVPSAPVAFAPAASKAVVAAAAAVVSKTPRTQPYLSAADLRRKSSCPGLYCNSGGEGREERVLQAQSTGTPESTTCRDQCANAETVAGEEVVSAEDGENGKISARDELLAPSGPKQGITTVVEKGGIPRPDEAYPMFQLPLKALVMNDEIVRFRTALISRQQGAAGAVAGEGRGHGWDVVHASTTSLAQKLARAPFFDEPAWARGGDDVSLQGTSVVESRAIAALRKRDRVRLYDNVPLCEACYREYSETWRWWLARGKESKPVDGVPRQAREALGTTHETPKLEEARGRRGRAKHDYLATAAIDTTALYGATGRVFSPGYTQGKPKSHASNLSTKLPVSSEMLPEGPALDNHSNNILGIDSTNENDNTKGGSCEGRSTTAASRRGKALSKPTQLDEDEEVSSAGTTAFQHQPGQRESEMPQNVASGADTSTLDTFRARLDRRLEGISIPRAGQMRGKCIGGGLKNAGRPADGTDGQREHSPVDSTTNTASAVKQETCQASASASLVANAEERRIGDPVLKGSLGIAVATVPVAARNKADSADAEPIAEEGAARGSTSIQRSNEMTQEPADKHRSRRMWEWENVRVDWTPKSYK